MEQKIAQGVYDFRIMREDGYVYVDKTDLLGGLVTGGRDAFYFISRPRRFGKSLMLSTLEYIFRGKRELFKGLAIDKLDYDWAEYPILHFSFGGIKAKTLEAFERNFCLRVKKVLTEAKCTWDEAAPPDANFNQAITDLAKQAGKPVVILIDEYDAPVGHALSDIKLASDIRQELSDFYIQIKECASDVRFLMMTGVTRFTQLSVFSALNNLTDLTMDSRYATLLGYTEEELEANFSPSLHAHADIMGLAYEDYRAELRRWYNGYRFARNSAVRVYNPVAIAKTIGPKEPTFVPTWSKTGRSSALINYLTMHDIETRDYENVCGVSESALDVCALEAIKPVSMLYQSGYLTIKDFKNPYFTLGVPNEEVRIDLNSLLLQYAAKEVDGETLRDAAGFALQKADFEAFFAQVRALFAHLPYGSTENRVPEAAYQRILYVLLSACPFRVTAEDRQAQGRADIVVESDERVFVFELKVDKTAAEALAQIKANDYAEPYRALGKPIHLIGLNFKSENHSLDDAVVETLD